MRPSSSTNAVWCSVLITLILVTVPFAGYAGTCSVPGTHATIQQAADDTNCTQIDLSGQTYYEILNITRSVGLSGPGAGQAVLIGQLSLEGASTVATVSDISVRSSCPDGAVRVIGGANLISVDMQAKWQGAVPCTNDLTLFDGFEN